MKDRALLVLLACQALVLILFVLFHLVIRDRIVSAFVAYSTQMPTPTQVALSSWLVPCVVVVACGLTLAALGLPLRTSRRKVILSVGLVLSSCCLVFVTWACFTPIFRPE